MLSLVQGQNTPLTGTRFQVCVSWSPAHAVAIDVSAFLLTEAGTVINDSGMVFYGQPRSPEGSVAMDSPGENNDNSAGGTVCFSIELSQLDAAIQRIAFTATTPAATSPPLSVVQSLDIRLTAPQSGANTDCVYAIETHSAPEAAMIVGELYRRGEGWKFRAVGQGFVGGLAPLAEHFGVEVDDPGTSPPAAAAAPAPPTSPTPPTPTPTPPAPTINLSKVSLSKARPSISLEKRGGSLGEIRVNLNWNQSVMGKGFFGQPKEQSIDLDLCCLVALKDGRKGAVQALGKSFGCYDRAPWVHLLGDDRTGRVRDGEWLKINGSEWNNIERIIIFALLYDGVPNWSATDGVVTLYVPDHPEVESRLDGESTQRVCAVATLQNDNGLLKMTQENQYFFSAKELDEHYGIGLSWTAGSK